MSSSRSYRVTVDKNGIMLARFNESSFFAFYGSTDGNKKGSKESMHEPN